MAAVCKPGGQLILLQHGKASWDWLNHRLDDEAQAHFVKWGCWWNRDILQLVHEVRSSAVAVSTQELFACIHLHAAGQL